MCWDVVEVKPEPKYGLFVKFKDGLTGRVQLRPEDLTGVLARLRDTEFFQQVFIDCGAVAWPGEIDLAPDAMYAQVASQRRGSPQLEELPDESSFRKRLPRLYELRDLVADPTDRTFYFQN